MGARVGDLPGHFPALILYAERDAPEIAAGCKALKNTGVRVVQVPGALHSDIFLLVEACAMVRDQIREWYGTRA